MDATVLVPSEPVTVILSEKGWIRAAKGHDIDAATLSYKAGDALKAAVRGRSEQLVVFLDSSGRTYALPAHTLPSARGQGEPLSSRLSPPDGATFVGLMLGHDEDVYLLASNAGYGFLVQLSELYTRNKAGKAVLTLPPGAEILSPVLICDPAGAMIVVISRAGRLLVFPAQDLAMLAKGKGYKLMGITTELEKDQHDAVSVLTCMPANTALKLWGGQRHLTLKSADVARYTGARGQRGSKLPRGFQRIDRVEILDAGVAAVAAPPLV
jgi:topoisomerase-4 subunit A